jgi:hypothetical protein
LTETQERIIVRRVRRRWELNPQNLLRGLTAFKAVELADCSSPPPILRFGTRKRLRSSAEVITAANMVHMAKKSLKVDREKFEGIVKSLIQAKPVKRDDVKVSKRKPERLIPPQNQTSER